MSRGNQESQLKSLEWVGSSKVDLIEFPQAIRKEIGYALYLAQGGEKAATAKPLRGFGGASVLEVVASYDGNAYRAVYTVTFADVLYVLHCFQKKSKKGVATPQSDIELVTRRLQAAVEHYQRNYARKKP